MYLMIKGQQLVVIYVHVFINNDSIIINKYMYMYMYMYMYHNDTCTCIIMIHVHVFTVRLM